MSFPTQKVAVVEVIGVYEYAVDITCDLDESIIGGPISINGIVLVVYMKDRDEVFPEPSMGVMINGIDASVAYPSVDYEYDALMASTGAGEGMMAKHESEEIDLPHTSFDVVNAQGDDETFKRTVVVIVINSGG